VWKEEGSKMRLYQGVERRKASSGELEMFVEIGVNYARTIGNETAVAFMVEHGVPLGVAKRVTTFDNLRRKTCWEQHVNESSLRHALGARPLR
jgi:hypothetical protein